MITLQFCICIFVCLKRTAVGSLEGRSWYLWEITCTVWTGSIWCCPRSPGSEGMTLAQNVVVSDTA